MYHAYHERHPDEASRDMIYPLLVHLGVWSAVGATGGLAFGIGLGAPRPAARCPWRTPVLVLVLSPTT